MKSTYFQKGAFLWYWAKIKKASITKRPCPAGTHNQSRIDRWCHTKLWTWKQIPNERTNAKNSAGIKLWYFCPYRPRTELHPRVYSYYFWLWKRNEAQTTDRQIHQHLAVTRYELQWFSCRMGWDEKKHYNSAITDEEFEDW